jgi:hypothetical protein
VARIARSGKQYALVCILIVLRTKGRQGLHPAADTQPNRTMGAAAGPPRFVFLTLTDKRVPDPK